MEKELLVKTMESEPSKLELEEIEKEEIIEDFGKDEITEMFKDTSKLNVEFILNAHERLVGQIANKLNNLKGSCEFEDLLQVGRLGVLHAIEKFDISLGYKFTTYAYYWVKQFIVREIHNFGRIIRKPVGVNEKYAKFKAIENQLRNELNREPLVEEIALKMGIEPNEIQKLMFDFKGTKNLNAKVGSEQEDELGDFVSDDTMITPDQSAMLNGLHKTIIEVLKTLTKQEQYVVVRNVMYGITLEQVGKELGVSKQRVQIVRDVALIKLKHPSRSKKLREYL